MPRFCQRSSEPRPSTDAADVRPGGQTHRSWLTDRLTAGVEDGKDMER